MLNTRGRRGLAGQRKHVLYRVGLHVRNLLRGLYRRDGAYSVGLCTEAVDLLFSASGAEGLFSEGALQRQFRDAHAIGAHIAFNFDAAGSNNGKLVFMPLEASSVIGAIGGISELAKATLDKSDK